MLKRKLYWIAIGIVLSQLSIAQYWNGGEPKSFGDCATCRASGGAGTPLTDSNQKLIDVVSQVNNNIGKKPTGFVNGNAINPALPQGPTGVQGPFVSPVFSLTPVYSQLTNLNLAQAQRYPTPAQDTAPILPKWNPDPSGIRDQMPSWWMPSQPTQVPLWTTYPYAPVYALPYLYL